MCNIFGIKKTGIKKVDNMAKIKFEKRLEKLVPLFILRERREDIVRSDMSEVTGMSIRSISRLTTEITKTDPESRPLLLSKQLTVYAMTGLEKLLDEKGPVVKKRELKARPGKVQKEIASSKKLQEEALKKMLKNKF